MAIVGGAGGVTTKFLTIQGTQYAITTNLLSLSGWISTFAGISGTVLNLGTGIQKSIADISSDDIKSVGLAGSRIRAYDEKINAYSDWTYFLVPAIEFEDNREFVTN